MDSDCLLNTDGKENSLHVSECSDAHITLPIPGKEDEIPLSSPKCTQEG